MENPTALITGASSGIGWDLACVFAENGYNLVLSARREDKLLELQKLLKKDSNSIEVIPGDLSEAGASEKLFEQIKSKDIHIHCLVNNAGFGASGNFSKISFKKQSDLLHVNINALTELTHLFVQDMLERGAGEILNVGSTAGFQAGPNMSVYYASKAYVIHFTEALAEELKPQGIKVTCLCPGATESEFQKAADMERSPLFERIMMPSRVVAEAGFKSLKKGQIICLPGWLNKITPIFSKLFPRSLIRRKTMKFNTQRMPD